MTDAGVERCAGAGLRQVGIADPDVDVVRLYPNDLRHVLAIRCGCLGPISWVRGCWRPMRTS